jgi:hypothetical protein
MARFKGLVLLNARAFCIERFGAPAWARVVDALPRDDRPVVEGAVHVGWYDLGIYDRVHEAIDQVLGNGDLTLMTAIGRFSAEHDLTIVHRLFFRMANPSLLLTKYGDYWKRYQDTGTWTVRRESDRRIRGTLASWGSVSPATCVRLAAYIQRMLDLVGARGTRVGRVKCRARGDTVCEYLVEWSLGATA